MQLLKRWLSNLRWLFNHPPVKITSVIPDGTTCDYCPAVNKLWRWGDDLCICHDCMKQAFDAVLNKK
jgi:hypothetical protein